MNWNSKKNSFGNADDPTPPSWYVAKVWTWKAISI